MDFRRQLETVYDLVFSVFIRLRSHTAHAALFQQFFFVLVKLCFGYIHARLAALVKVHLCKISICFDILITLFHSLWQSNRVCICADLFPVVLIANVAADYHLVNNKCDDHYDRRNNDKDHRTNVSLFHRRLFKSRKVTSVRSSQLCILIAGFLLLDRRVAEGARILAKILGVKRAVVAIEDNKPEAADAMRAAVQKAEATGADEGLPKIEVAQLPTRYPQGAEKMLIYAITGREVPLGGLPMDAGTVVQNVATAAAIYDACAHGIPLIERITTVSGDAIATPKNLRVRIGTSYQAAIDYCGGFVGTPDKVLAGGPMMGRAQERLDVPITKGSSGILALTRKLTEHGPELHCIRCGRCVQACPMGLIPSMLSILGQRKDVARARDDYGVMNCVECGCCTYVCPAKRNIVQYIRATKGAVKALAAKEKAKAAAREAAAKAKENAKEAAKA